MARILDQNTVDQLTLADGQFIFDSEPSLRGLGVRLRIDAKGRLTLSSGRIRTAASGGGSSATPLG